jgi:alpha-beta hydrolase superfamily lysophospholipase
MQNLASATEKKLKTFDGIDLYCKVYEPVGRPVKATICFVHGLGGHLNNVGTDIPFPWLTSMLQHFLNADFRVMGYDHRCFGRSSGARAYIPSYDTLLDDLDFVIRHSEMRFPDVPLILYGQSMGGQIVTYYALEMAEGKRSGSPVSAVVASAPWYSLAFEPPKWKIAVGRLFGKCFPKMKLPSDAKFSDFCDQDEDKLDALYNDGLGTKFVTAGLFFGASDAAQYIVSHASAIQVPFFVIHGKKDKVTSWNTSEKVYEAVGSAVKSIALLEDGFHDMHNGRSNEAYCTAVIGWIDRWLAQYASPASVEGDQEAALHDVKLD